MPKLLGTILAEFSFKLVFHINLKDIVQSLRLLMMQQCQKACLKPAERSIKTILKKGFAARRALPLGDLSC